MYPLVRCYLIWSLTLIGLSLGFTVISIYESMLLKFLFMFTLCIYRYPIKLPLYLKTLCAKTDWLSTLIYPASPWPWLHTSRTVEWNYGTMRFPPSSEGRRLLTKLTNLRASTELTWLWEEYSFGKIYPSPTRILIFVILIWLFTWHVFWLQGI